MRSLLAALVLAVGCSSAPPRWDPNISDPPPGPYPPGPPYGTETGAYLGGAGMVASSLGAQMLREDDALFDWVGKHKRQVGAATAGAGAALLTATLVDAALNDNRDRFAEYLYGSGAAERVMPSVTDDPELEHWVQSQP